MKAIAVIGAAFGDEGKGRMVDHFASKNSKSVIVRYNGGSQAAHTVVTPDSKRFTFHHFGSGTALGLPTYLTSTFIVNPTLWQMELDSLVKANLNPTLFVNGNAPVTTFYDMLINREIEKQRGKDAHGSCGYGINETIERFLNHKYRLVVKDLLDKDKLVNIVQMIRHQWVPLRLKQLGITKPSQTFIDQMAADCFEVRFLEYSESFVKSVSGRENIPECEVVIFEGAQGLLLDEEHHFFPHVTRSRTGLPYITHLFKQNNIDEIEVVYAMRAYMTRHGNGPFPTFDESLSYEDKTNVPNDFQGKMRFGILDLDLIKEAITKDRKYLSDSIKSTISVAITCLDQVKDMVKVQCNKKEIEVKRDALPTFIKKIMKANKAYVSASASRLIK